MNRWHHAVVWIRMLGMAGLFSGTTILPAQGQPEFQIRQIKVDLVDTPMIHYGGAAVPSLPAAPVFQQKWLRIESSYDSFPAWVDEMRLEYFVSAGSPQNPGVLTGRESYVNIPRGVGHLAVIFLHPRTVQRYLNSQKPRQVTVLLYVQDRLISGQSLPPNNKPWWEQPPKKSGLFLSRMQTPWGVLNNDRYEESKPTP